MSFWTQLFVVVVASLALTWFTRARLMAMFVSWLATRQRGVNVKLESVTLSGATQVLVTLSSGGSVVKDVHCRRIKIGWISSTRSELDASPTSDGGSDGEDDGHVGSGLQRLLVSLSRLRVHIQLVGVRVRLRAERDERDERGERGERGAAGRGAPDGAGVRDSTAHAFRTNIFKSSWNANVLIRRILPFVSVDVHDVEVSSDVAGASSSTVLLRGKKVGIDMKRSEQVLVLEHIFVCPGARVVQGDKVHHECGFIELDSAALTSASSLQDLLGSFRRTLRKRAQNGKVQRLSLDVNSLRMNWDPAYVLQAQAVFGGGRSEAPTSSQPDEASGSGVSPSPSVALEKSTSPYHLICCGLPPITFQAALSSVMVQVPHSGCFHEFNLRGLTASCETSPSNGDTREGTMESALSWDSLSVAVGSRIRGLKDAVALQCQSSRTASTLQIHVPYIMCGTSQSPGNSDGGRVAISMEGGVDVGALHTKVHHEHLRSWLEALHGGRHGRKKRKKPERGIPSANQQGTIDCYIKLSIGNGSSMQFVDCAGVCMLHQSLDAAFASLKKTGQIYETKFDILGIAMAEETQDSRSNSQSHGGVQLLSQVLSNRSFSGGMELDELGDAAFSVSVIALSGKISNKLMANGCTIAGSILEAVGTKRNSPIAANVEATGGLEGIEAPGNTLVSGEAASVAETTKAGTDTQSVKRFSLRVDLLDVNLAMLSSFVVEKHHSSVNLRKELNSALAVRIQNFGAAKTVAGLCKLNSETVSVLYYEGVSEEDFSLDFDVMDDSIHSTPLSLQGLQLDDVLSRPDATWDECERRVTVGPLQAYLDADALISMVHFTKSLEGVFIMYREPSLRNNRPMAGASLGMKTIVAAKNVAIYAPISSDREISLHMINGVLEHEKNLTAMRTAEVAVLSKGVETIVTKGVQLSVSASNSGGTSKEMLNVSVEVEDARFILPHDRDPGPTFKVFSLYVNACKQLMDDIKGAGAQGRPSSASPATFKHVGQPDRSFKARDTPLELDVSVIRGKVVFQHHPLERWFASHSNAVRHAALVEHLWDEAHASVISEGHLPQNPLHSGKSQNEMRDGSANKCATPAHPKSWRNIMSRHASSHIKRMSADNESLALYEELFEVDINDVKLNAALDTTPGAGIRFVHAVDEPSRAVAINSPMLFDVDLSGSRVDVKFGGCNRPLYSGTGVIMTGKVALAKQATAPPETCARVLHVGMHYVKEMNVPLRGTCPPMKVFTDVSMQTDTSNVFFSPGLEPVLGLMGVTSKRLVPSDPGSISKKPPPVPWWDDLRYFWRGFARVSSRALGLVLLPGLSPTYSKLSERLEVEAKDVEVALIPGNISLETGVLRMMAFRKTLEENGLLCVFPVADVKSMVANLSVTWSLPTGADPNYHYVFPNDLPDKQSPVFVADVYKASALDVVIDVSLRRASDDLDPPGLFIGGEIVSFWRKFVRDWEIPTFIKNQVRRGTFFVRKPKLPGKKKGLPKLLKELKVRVESDDLQLTHFTLDGKDPGGGLVVSTTRGQWEFTWHCNMEIQSFLTPPPHAKIETDLPIEERTKTAMSHLAVDMEHVTVKSLQFSSDGESTPTSNIFRPGRLATDSTIASMSSDSPTAAAYDDVVDSHWLAERVVIVKSMSEEATQFGERRMKPLKVSVKDCYFMTDLELRDAIWATVEHLIAAFEPSEKQPSMGTLRSAPSHGVQFVRSYSRQSEMSDEGGDNELLNLLLQQRNANGSSSLASPQAPVELDRHTSAHLESDIIPMTSSLDDSSSELKYEVEVSNLQLVLQRDQEVGSSRGRLLLATKSATLRGATTDAHSITTLDMEEVQAYISLTLIDPSADIVWLEIAEDGKEFIAPSVEERESVWRRVFNPINMNLRHSKYMPLSMTRYVIQSQSPASPARQGEELVLKIPEIAAVMDGREFEVLIDVVSFLIMSGPTVHTCHSVRNLGRDVAENSRLANDQMLLELSSRQLGCIRGEATGLLLGMPDSRSSEIWGLSEPLPFSGALKITLDASVLSDEQPSAQLRKYIEQGKDYEHNTTLLLRWSQEQESLALEDYNLTKRRLEETSESLKRQTQVKSASRVLIHLNRVVWQLCDQERVPFVQASIKKAVFDRRRNRDRSGSVRFTIHSLDVLDATGALPEGPATSAGVILTNWNPDSSYEREPMLRVISTLGVPTSKYDVFEHLDASLHPLTLHLTEQVATACWEYFFPKEDQKSRQEAFSSSISSKKFAPTMQPSPRKSSFTASDNLSQGTSPLVRQESDVSSRSDAQGTTRLSSPSMKRRDSPMIKRKTSALRLQKRFKYVKLNRAHMRITYVGKPIGIKDRVLVINSYACENLDGSWRDLLSNVKQKAIFSALFSGLGLQGRKVKELMTGAAPSIKSVELPSSEEEDLANNRGLLAKFGLKQGNHRGTSHRRKSDDPETQKKRALFGESILHRLHRRGSSNASSPRGDVPEMPSPVRAHPSSVPRKHAVPLLELTKPLPKDESSDSDESLDIDGESDIRNEVIDANGGISLPIGLAPDAPGPLGAGIGLTTGVSSVKYSVDKSMADPLPSSKYDPPTWATTSQSHPSVGPMERLSKK
jgi:hypothetical protein